MAAGDPLRAVKLVGEQLKANPNPLPAASLTSTITTNTSASKKDWRLQVLDIARYDKAERETEREREIRYLYSNVIQTQVSKEQGSPCEGCRVIDGGLMDWSVCCM